MKQNIFKTQAFKCIVVLLLITVLMCGLLAVLNDALYVPEEERLSRAVLKVYGKSVDAEKKEIDGDRVETELGSIDEYYTFTDEGVDYELFKSTGANGYKNGTVTLWVLIGYKNGEAVAVDNVQLDSYEKQTLMSSFGSDFFEKYTALISDQLKAGTLFKTGNTKYDHAMLDETDVRNVVTGATRSSNAINNAVNIVLLYVWGDLT